MMLIKLSLNRAIKYKNKAHQEAITQLCNQISNRLSIDIPKDKIKFLKILLQDYIVLTR